MKAINGMITSMLESTGLEMTQMDMLPRPIITELYRQMNNTILVSIQAQLESVHLIEELYTKIIGAEATEKIIVYIQKNNELIVNNCKTFNVEALVESIYSDSEPTDTSVMDDDTIDASFEEV